MTLLIVDGTNLAHRSYFALKASTHGVPLSKQGHPIASMSTVLPGIVREAENHKCSKIVVVFDSHHPTWRHELYPKYKANHKEKDELLIKDIELLRDSLELTGIGLTAPAGYEADDVIGAIAKAHQLALIYSADRDLYQLLNDKVWQLNPHKSLLVVGDHIPSILGVKASQVADYKALAGDPSDNIPGIKGIGSKTAQKLLAQYESVEEIYANLAKITGKPYTLLRGQESEAMLWKKLATLKTDVELDENLFERIKIKNLNLSVLVPTLLDLGLSAIATQFEDLVF